MPPRRGGRSASRRNTPVSPLKTRSDTLTPRQTRRSTRSTSHDVDRDQIRQQGLEINLQPLEEDDESLAQEDANAEDDISVPDSSGAYSSNSSDERDALDRDEIVDNLADLYHDSSKLLGSIIRADHDTANQLFDELQRDSGSRKRALTNMKRYAISREAFGPRLYIEPSLILRKLKDGAPWPEISYGDWRPDAILYMANLAQFVATIAVGSVDQIEEALNYMFNSFPEPFCAASMGSVPYGLSHLNTLHSLKTFNLGLDLRTQFFIRNCQAQLKSPAFDPDTTLQEIFLNGEGKIHGTEIRGVELSDLDTAAQVRIVMIRKYFTTNSRKPIDVQKLQAQFPWVDFVSRLAEWTVLRQEELEQQLASQRGVDAVVALIRQGNYSTNQGQTEKAAVHQSAYQNDKNDKQLAASASVGSAQQQTGQKSAPPTGTKLEKNIARLKDLKAQSAARRSGASIVSLPATPPIHREILQSPEVEVPEVAEDEPVVVTRSSDVVAQQNKYIHEVLNSQAAQSNKENDPKPPKSLMDRQENAVRIAFDSEGERSQSPAKRRRQPESDDEDSDAFEEDKRSTKKSRADKGKQRAMNGRLLDEVREDNITRVEANEERHLTPQRRRTLASTQPARSTLPQRSMQPPPSSAPATRSRPQILQPLTASQGTYAEAVEVNAMAKETVRAAKNQIFQASQVRKGYSQDEIERLINLIAHNGTRWAKMLSDDLDEDIFPDGPKLQSRSQVQLKDKARNLKLDYLKARQVLPEGFESVSIGQRQINMLRDLGIEYVEGDARGHLLQ